MNGDSQQNRCAAAVVALLCSFVLSSCGSEDVVGDSVARNGAAQAGQAAFKASGHEINGKLACTTADKSDDKMDVSCTGTTKDGEPAELSTKLDKGAKIVTGDGAKISGATVTGTVDGKEVFKKDCIGSGC